MQSTANTPEAYLNELPADRREAMSKLRSVINKNIYPSFSEQMIYGSIGWVVPKELYPAGYHVNPDLPLPFINLANQKNYIALYHLGVYNTPQLLEWFETEYPKSGHKLDMGKSCIRFKSPDQIPYELIGKLVSKSSLEEYLRSYLEATGK